MPESVLQQLAVHTGLGSSQLQVERLQLVGVTRGVAAQWRQRGALVAVWDSGHHSCLAAAIRLSAVYRLPGVALLKADE
jgi:hypothetical protein